MERQKKKNDSLIEQQIIVPANTVENSKEK